MFFFPNLLIDLEMLCKNHKNNLFTPDQNILAYKPIMHASLCINNLTHFPRDSPCRDRESAPHLSQRTAFCFLKCGSGDLRAVQLDARKMNGVSLRGKPFGQEMPASKET